MLYLELSRFHNVSHTQYFTSHNAKPPTLSKFKEEINLVWEGKRVIKVRSKCQLQYKTVLLAFASFLPS